METKIYGNLNVVGVLESMLKSERVPHAVLFYGEKGLGKKTLASWLSSRIAAPGQSINPMSYPDIIWAKKGGASQTFSVDTVREVSADAFVLPNNGDRKVYIFADCEGMRSEAQNALLKIIEEPPPFVHFIFTAGSREVFLPTIISRTVCFGVSVCSEDECRMALAEKGYDNEKISGALSAFPGNIGMQISYIEDERTQKTVKIIRDITNGINSFGEYKTLKAFAELESEKNRAMAKEVMALLDKIVMDSLSLKFDVASRMGPYPEGAQKMAEVLSVSKALKLHALFSDAAKAIDSNANLNLFLSALCGKIFSL